MKISIPSSLVSKSASKSERFLYTGRPVEFTEHNIKYDLDIKKGDIILIDEATNKVRHSDNVRIVFKLSRAELRQLMAKCVLQDDNASTAAPVKPKTIKKEADTLEYLQQLHSTIRTMNARSSSDTNRIHMASALTALKTDMSYKTATPEAVWEHVQARKNRYRETQSNEPAPNAFLKLAQMAIDYNRLKDKFPEFEQQQRANQKPSALEGMRNFLNKQKK